MTPSMAKEATTASAGNNRACSDGGNRKDECGGSEGTGVGCGGSSKKESLRYGSRLGTELLCMWGIWAHGP